jgi:hypothetical protein
MSMKKDPDPELTKLLALLDTCETLQEMQQLVEQSSPQTPDSQEPIDDGTRDDGTRDEGTRFAAMIVSIMSKGPPR